MSANERRQLDRVRRQLEKEKAKLQEDKSRFRQQQRQLETDRRQLTTQKKQLKNAQAKLSIARKNTSGRRSPGSSPRAGSPNRREQLESAEWKKKYQASQKKFRALHSKYQDLQAKYKLAQRQLKKKGRGGGPNQDRKIRNLEKEIRNLKKQLRLLKKDWEKRRRYYRTQTARFKNEQDKWLRNQRQQHPTKIIKYVFLDDIRAIKVYRRGKAVVRFVARDGGEWESEQDIEIEYADAEAEAARAAAEQLAEESFMEIPDEELGTGDVDPDDEAPVDETKEADEDDYNDEAAVEDDPNYEDEDNGADEDGGDEDGDESPGLTLTLSADASEDLEAFDAVEVDLDDDLLDDELDMDNLEDEEKQPEIDLTNYVEKEVFETVICDVNEFLKELRSRTTDLHSINETLERAIDAEEIDEALKQLVGQVQERHTDLSSTLRNLGDLDVIGLDEPSLGDLNQNWQDEIYRISQVNQTKASSTAPLGVTETVSQMLEEMDARTNDLVQLQDLKEKTDFTNEEKEEEVKGILDRAEDRHSIAKSKMDESDPDVSDFLDRTNNTWEVALQQLGVSMTDEPEPVVQPPAETQEEKAAPGPAAAMRSMHDRTPTLRELIVQKQDGDKTTLQELNSRTDDLQQIVDSYGTPTHPELLRDLRNQIENRHRAQVEEDNISQPMQDDNTDWEELIGKMGAKAEEQKAQQDSNATVLGALAPEMDSRNEDLQTILNVLNGDEPPRTLEDLALNVEERHKAYDPAVESASPAQEVYRKLLFDLAQKKQLSPPPAELEEKRDQLGDFNQFVADQCMKELKSRISDVSTLKQLDPTDVDMLQQMLESVADRHERQKQALRQANKNMPSEEDDTNRQRETMFEKMAGDNERWQEELGVIQQQAKDTRKLRQRYAQCLDELNQRTADLERLSRLLESKDEEENKDEAAVNSGDAGDAGDAGGAATEEEKGDESAAGDEQKATDDATYTATEAMEDDAGNESDGGVMNYQTQVAHMLEEIEERHAEEKEKINDTLTSADNQETAEEFNTNNDDWRTAIGGILGYEAEEEKEEVVDDTPWLKKDPLRNELIERIMVDPEQLGSPFCLRDVGVYLNRVFAEDEDLMLYMPIDTEGDDLKEIDQEVLSKTFDGVLLNKLVNIVQPDFSDMRAVHTTDPIDPFPISDAQVLQNIQLLLGTCKALGVKMGRSHKPRDWFKPEKQARMLRDIVDGLARRYIDFLVNLDVCPQLVRLTKELEDKDVVKHLDGVDWIPRWLNHLNGDRPVTNEILDFNRDLSRAVGTFQPDFDGNAAAAGDDMSNAQALEDVSQAIGIRTRIPAQDLADNNRKCQDLLAAQIFAFNQGMEPLSAEEIRMQEEILSKDTSSDENYLNWLNSMGLVDEEIDNLYRDLSDGVVLLKLLDRLKSGVVQWKGVRIKVRHKFDKMTNCKKAIGYCRDPFNFKIIGFDSDDLVGGHQKFIHSLLWQIMRYHATRALADLNHGQQVRDEDIIQFANLQVSGLESPYSRPISSLKDKSLTNGLYYLDVIRSVAPDSVREDLIFAEVPRVPKPEDGSLPQRLANIRYAASLIRRLGGDLFATPEDLLRMDARAVLSLLAAIMTISVKGATEMAEDDDLMNQVLSGPING